PARRAGPAEESRSARGTYPTDGPRRCVDPSGRHFLPKQVGSRSRQRAAISWATSSRPSAQASWYAFRKKANRFSRDGPDGVTKAPLWVPGMRTIGGGRGGGGGAGGGGTGARAMNSGPPGTGQAVASGQPGPSGEQGGSGPMTIWPGANLTPATATPGGPGSVAGAITGCGITASCSQHAGCSPAAQARPITAAAGQCGHRLPQPVPTRAEQPAFGSLVAQEPTRHGACEHVAAPWQQAGLVTAASRQQVPAFGQGAAAQSSTWITRGVISTSSDICWRL